MESEGKFSLVRKYLKEKKSHVECLIGFSEKIFGPVQNVVCIVINKVKV